jgi:choline dehydrogenase-like flavoprotein
MPAQNHYDIIIIGSGAGGGTLAYQLAPSGKKILILERGGFVPRELDNWSSRAAVREEKYHAPEHWLDSSGNEFQPGTHYNVGGNTKFYGAALFRMREQDFGNIRHFGGISPAWPISYDELELYYTQAEYLYEVRGERGVDPTEPKTSAPYPFPAVSHEPRIEQLHHYFQSKGLRPFHVPLGIRLEEKSSLSRCIRCQTCDGYPCLIDAKADAQTMCVQPALRHGNVTLLTDARALQLTTHASGRSVRSVIVNRHGELEEYSADIVVLSCGAVNSAALLLRSANDKHPNGLANSSDLVGRHYMAHNNSVLFVFSLKANPTVFQKTIALNDFYFRSHVEGDDFPLGHVSMVGKFDGQMFKAGAPPLAPLFLLNAMGKRSLDFWLTSEDLPDLNNRVTLNADGRIVLHYKENNLEAHRRLIATLKILMKDWDGGWFVTKGGKIPLAGVAHQCGTLRFGHDPRTSVLNVNCKAHDLDNLYVVDGSFFVSSSAVNPALTIMANALRVGNHLLERMGCTKETRHVPAARLSVVA